MRTVEFGLDAFGYKTISGVCGGDDREWNVTIWMRCLPNSQASERLVPSWWLCGDHRTCGLAGESTSLGVLSKSKRCAILSLPSLPPVYGSRCELSGAASATCHLLPPLRHHRLLSLWNQKPEIIPSFSKKPWATKKVIKTEVDMGEWLSLWRTLFCGRFYDFETRKC